MAGFVDMIFTSKFLYISTVAIVLINTFFFPNLLNNKDIKLMDMSYLISDKSYNTPQTNISEINQIEHEEVKGSFVFLILSVAGLLAVIYVLFKDFDKKNTTKDEEDESLLSVSTFVNNKKTSQNISSVGYSLVETEAGDD